MQPPDLRSARLVVATGADIPRILPMMREFNLHEGIAVDEALLVPALGKLLADATLGGLWLLEHDGRLVGYVVLTFGFDLEWAGRDAWLTELWIIPEARGGGMGRAALAAIEIEASRLGVRALHLMVRHENVEARGLYESAGFRAPPRETLTKRLPSP